jgi:DNA-binding transcriptional ArsR family regulator
MQLDGPLSLKKQRILLAIRTSEETDTDGRPKADFSQLREWTDISRGSMQYQFDSLEEDGLIEVSYRDLDEMDTEREPPKLAILPEEVVDAIDTAGLTRDAFFESVAETADPRTFSSIFDRMDAVEELVEAYREDSISYYKKASRAGTDARERAAKLEERLNEIAEAIDSMKTHIRSLNGFVEAHGDRLDALDADCGSLGNHVNKSFETVRGRFDSLTHRTEEHEARLTRVEAYLAENGGKLRTPQFDCEERVC